MIIEYSNAIEPKNHSTMAMAIVITACAFFFIPTSLIILGYYSSQPTGTLVSPLPQGTLSQKPSPTPTQVVPSVTPSIVPENQPIIASDNTATEAASKIVSEPGSNINSKVATIEIGTKESTINDPAVNENSAIYLSPRPGDKGLYSLKSKAVGQFTIGVGDISDIVRYIDYHIVNP